MCFHSIYRSDVYLPCDVSRSKKTAQFLLVILKSSLQKVRDIWEFHHQVQKKKSCSLCNQTWQRLCVLMRIVKIMSSFNMHLLWNQSSKAPQWFGLEPERCRMNVSIVSLINEIIFIQQAFLTDVYCVNKSIWASPLRSLIQTTRS